CGNKKFELSSWPEENTLEPAGALKMTTRTSCCRISSSAAQRSLMSSVLRALRLGGLLSVMTPMLPEIFEITIANVVSIIHFLNCSAKADAFEKVGRTTRNLWQVMNPPGSVLTFSRYPRIADKSTCYLQLDLLPSLTLIEYERIRRDLDRKSTRLNSSH